MRKILGEKKVVLGFRVRESVKIDFEKRASENNMIPNELGNKILEKYVSDEHDKWFQKNNSFMFRIFKKIEDEGWETNQVLMAMFKEIRILGEMFSRISSTKSIYEQSVRDVEVFMKLQGLQTKKGEQPTSKTEMGAGLEGEGA